MNVLSGYDIFISYSRRDASDYARKLYQFLKSLDYTCFLDRHEAPGGVPLQSTLKSALLKSRVLVVIADNAALLSGHVASELAIFAATDRPIIPIGVDGALKSQPLKQMPWSVILERDIIWLDETAEALRSGMPSPGVYEGIQTLFQYTRRNVVRRLWATVLLSAILLAAGIAVWQAFAAREQERIATMRTADLQTKAKELEARTRDLKKAEDGLTRSNRDLEAERDRLTRANSDLKLERSRLENKTQEAAANAKQAKQHEEIAMRNAANAERSQQAAQALAAASRAQREFENDPLLGLSTALEALQSCPAAEEAAKATIGRVVRSLLIAGRVGRLDQSDFVQPFFIHDASFFVLKRPAKPGQIMDTATGQVRAVLDSEVISVRNAGEGVWTQDNPRSLPYFVIEYPEGQKEIRRKRDGSVLLRGSIDAVGYNYARSDEYFQIRRSKDLHEMRRLDNDKVAVEPHTAYRVPNAPYSLITYARRTELRRNSDNELLDTIEGPVSAPNFGVPFQFSKDRSLYAITFEPAYNEFETKLYRTFNRERVSLNGNASLITFDPASTAYVVAYKNLPGEFRRSDDGSTVIPLSDVVKDVAYDSVTGEFMLRYATKPCESRRQDGSVLAILPSRCEYLHAFGNPPLFHVVYENRRREVLMRAGKELAIASYPDEAEPELQPKSKFFLTDHQVRHYSDGQKVAIEGFPDSAGDYIKGTRFILLRCESSQAVEDSPRITAQSGSRRRPIPPPVATLPVGPPTTPFDFGTSDCNPAKTGLLDILTERVSVMPGALRLTGISPRKRYLALEDREGKHYLVDTLGNPAATPIPAGSPYFSAGDEHLLLNSGKTWYSIKLPEGATSAKWTLLYGMGLFSPDATLFFTSGKGSGEIRLAASGRVVLDSVSKVDFSGTGKWFVAAFPNGRQEIWAGGDNPHRLTELGLGVTGVHVDDARERAFVWYQDRQAYFIDLRWLEIINGLPPEARPDLVVEAGCYPFLRDPLRITAVHSSCR